MARSPSRGGSKPRSLGSFAAFFDFYQNQAARSSLTHDKCGDSIQPAGIERLGCAGAEFFSGKEEQNQGVSVRDMLAQLEPAKKPTSDVKSTTKTSNVVAKLMGLETVPGSSANVQTEKHFTRREDLASNIPSDRYHHSRTASHCSAGPHCVVDDLIALRQSRCEEPHKAFARSPIVSKRTCSHERMHEDPTCRRMCKSKDLRDNGMSFPGEEPGFLFAGDNDEDMEAKIQPPQGDDMGTTPTLKRTHSEIVGLGSFQRKKRPTFPSAMPGPDPPKNQMLVRKMVNAVKLLVKKKLIHSKYSKERDKLCEAKELTSTINFLEANRDYFRKFLQDPYPESARKSHNSELQLLKGPIRESNDCHEMSVDGLQKRFQMEKPELQWGTSSHTQRGLKDDKKCGTQAIDVKHPTAVNIVVLRPGTGKVVTFSDKHSHMIKNATEGERDVLEELRGRFQVPHSKNTVSQVDRPFSFSTDDEQIERQPTKHVREHARRNLTECSMDVLKLRNPEPNRDGTLRKIEHLGREKHLQNVSDQSHSIRLQDVCEWGQTKSATEQDAGRRSTVLESERESLCSSIQNRFRTSTSPLKQVSPADSSVMNLHSKGDLLPNYKSTFMKVRRNDLDALPQSAYESIRSARREVEYGRHSIGAALSDRDSCAPTNCNLPEDHVIIKDITSRHYEHFLRIIENSCQRSVGSPSESSARFSGDEMMSIMSDVSKDSTEQPSPISVLDGGFSYSAASKAVNSTEMKDLELRVRFLKSLQQQRVQESDTFEEADQFNSGITRQLQSNFYDLEVLVSNDIFTQKGVECSVGKDTVLLYLRSLLVESGLTTDDTAAMTSVRDSSQSVVNSIFEKMKNKRSQIIYSIFNDRQKGGKMDFFSPLLLFDRVEEMLHDILQPKPDCVMSLQDVNLGLHRWGSNLVGEDSVKTLWSDVCELLHSEGKTPDTLEKLVENELDKCHLLEMGLQIEVVVFEVEGAILNDVILEMVASL